MRRITPLQLLSTVCLVASWIHPTASQDEQDIGDFVSSFFDALIPEELEDTVESIAQQVMELEETVENITQQVIDIDFSEMLTNITIPEELMHSINVDVLFSEAFGSILAFFGIPGYQQYERDDPFYADPVPYLSECQFCNGKFDKTKEFAGLSCEEWEIFAGFSQGEECSILRAAAVKHCGCNMWGEQESQTMNELFPPKTCSLCHDQAQEDKLFTFVGTDRVLPTLSDNLRCSDLLELPAVDGEAETCGDIGRLSEFCGCNLVLPPEDQCTLCPQGTLPSNREKIVLFGENVGRGASDLTCAQLHNKFATKEGSLAGDASCKAAQRQLTSMLGADVRNFCGCPSRAAPWVQNEVPVDYCEPCADGYQIRPDNDSEEDHTSDNNHPPRVTCQDWGEEVKTLLADDPICTALTTSVMPGCCIPIPTEEPMVTVENLIFKAPTVSAATVPATAGSLLAGFIVLANLLI